MQYRAHTCNQAHGATRPVGYRGILQSVPCSSTDQYVEPTLEFEHPKQVFEALNTSPIKAP